MYDILIAVTSIVVLYCFVHGFDRLLGLVYFKGAPVKVVIFCRVMIAASVTINWFTGAYVAVKVAKEIVKYLQ